MVEIWILVSTRQRRNDRRRNAPGDQNPEQIWITLQEPADLLAITVKWGSYRDRLLDPLHVLVRSGIQHRLGHHADGAVAEERNVAQGMRRLASEPVFKYRQ